MWSALLMVIRCRFAVFLCLSLSAVFSAIQLPQLEWRLNARELIPADGAESRTRAAESVFGTSDTLVLAVIPGEGDVFAPSTLSTVKRLSDEISTLPGVETLRSISTVPQMTIDAGELTVVPKLAERPIDEALAKELRDDVERAGLDRGMLVAGDHRATTILVGLAAESDHDQIITAINRLIDAQDDRAPQLVLAGASLAQAELGSALICDLVAFLPATTLVLGFLLAALFRHTLPVFVILTKLALTTLLTAGAMVWLGLAVYVPTLILPVVILVIAVSDDIYVIDHCLNRSRQNPHADWQEVIAEGLRQTAPAVLFSALTTSGGLLALLLTDLNAYEDFALAGAAGILTSFLLTVLFVPVCLSLAGRGTVALAAERRRHVQVLFQGLWPSRPDPKRRVLCFAGAVVVLGCVAIPRLHINDNWLANLPEESRVVTAYATLSRHFTGTTQLHLLVEDTSGASLLDDSVAGRVFEADKRLAFAEGVGGFVPVHDDILRLNAALNGVPFETYDQIRRDGGTESGELVQGDLVIRTFRRYPLAPRVTTDGKNGVATLYLTDADYRSVGALLDGPIAALNGSDLGLRVTPYGEAWDGYRTIDLVVDGFPRTLAGALLATFLLVALLFMSLRAAMIVLLPTLSTVVLLHVLLVSVGKSLGIATAMFAAIALGAGIDYSIHLLVAYRNACNDGLAQDQALDAAMALTAPATLSAALAVFGGISVLVLSSVPPNLDLGILICASLVISAVLSLWLVPSMLSSPEKVGSK